MAKMKVITLAFTLHSATTNELQTRKIIVTTDCGQSSILSTLHRSRALITLEEGGQCEKQRSVK